MRPLAYIILGLWLAACGAEPTPTDNERELLPDPEGEAHDTLVAPTDTIEEVSNEPEPVDTTFMAAELNVNNVEDCAKIILGEDMIKGGMMYYLVKDLANGYLQITGAFEGWYDFVLWRTDEGSLVGVATASCATVCDQSIRFYVMNENGTATEKPLDELFPLEEMELHQNAMMEKVKANYELEYEDDHQLWYYLPQNGTSIRLYLDAGANEYHFPIMDLAWTGSYFQVEEIYDSISLESAP